MRRRYHIDRETALPRPRRFCAAVLWVFFLWGCAAAEHISRGDELSDAGKYKEAIVAYRRALRVSPDNESAKEGIRRARREAVAAVLRQAQKKLTKGDYAAALSDTLLARRMPLDLDEVELAGDLDETISRASRRAEDKVQELVDGGLFLLAVELAQQVARASPSESRNQWATDIRTKAAAHFESLAADLVTRGLLGSAALQLAMAKHVGAEVEARRVAELWDSFTQPICFGEPSITVHAEDGVAPDVVVLVDGAARAELATLRARCGAGNRPLTVRIELEDVVVVDRKQTTQAIKALPGSGIETTEVYYEERPYTVEQEVIEYETRIEKRERRDCAPRPGKPRGCETWREEVEVTVPVKKVREVRKTERVKKTRPARGPFPPDKVVTYDVTSVERRLSFGGRVAVAGSETEPRRLAVALTASDSANAEVRHPKILIRADPMTVETMAELKKKAGSLVSAEVHKAVALAVAALCRGERELAQKSLLAGQALRAEELYLGLIALGAVDDPGLRDFFQRRYGKPVGSAMDYLLVAMGYEVKRRPPGSTQGVPRFLSRGTQPAGEEPARSSANRHGSGESRRSADRPAASQMDEEDLRLLEEASLAGSGAQPRSTKDAATPTPSVGAGAPAPTAGGGPEVSQDPRAGGDSSGTDKNKEEGSDFSAPEREPVIPKSSP